MSEEALSDFPDCRNCVFYGLRRLRKMICQKYGVPVSVSRSKNKYCGFNGADYIQRIKRRG